MTITVIVPTYRRPEYLRRCLQSLENQERRADCIMVVVARDDASSRDVAAATRDRGFPVVILDAPLGGMRTALNLAFDRCTTDIMALTDDDAETYPGWLSLIEKHFTADSTLGGLGGRDELQYSNRPDLTDPSATDCIGILNAFGTMHGNHHHPPISDLLEIDCLKGVNMVLRRKALGDIRIDSTLRGEFAQVAGEIILTFQIRARGWKILFDKQLTIRHWIAPRPLEDSRTAVTLKSGADAVYNSTYAIVAYGPLLRSLLFAFRGILVGSRLQPGVLGTLYLMVTGDFEAWHRFRNQFPSRFQGLSAGLLGWIRNSRRLFFYWPVIKPSRD